MDSFSNPRFSHYSNRKDVVDIELILYTLNEIKNELNNEIAKSFVEKLIRNNDPRIKSNVLFLV